MKVLLLGSTGYLGSAISDRLVVAGHQVVAVVRQHGGGPGTRVADLASPSTLRAAVTSDIDAVVHAATPLGDWERERESVQAMIEALGASDKAFIYLSGTWVLGAGPDPGDSTRAYDETSPVRPIPLVAGRETVEQLVRESPVTGVVVRPGIVHGRGGGIPAMLTAWAGKRGRGRYVGSAATATWPMVHVNDLARLVEIAVTDALPGDLLHGIGQPAVPVAEIARAADVAAGGVGVAESWDLSDATTVLGLEFATALATSQVVSTTRAVELGWSPVHPDIVTDLVDGSYAVKQPA